MVKRDKYYRIFKDDEQIEKLRLNMDIDKNFDNLKYMTLEQFKKDYILPLYSKEKGLNVINIDNFKKENRIIRNLSQLSYRLLNYIFIFIIYFFLLNYFGSYILSTFWACQINFMWARKSSFS